MPCNRGCRNESLCFSPRERWHEIAIRRVWRPPLRQASAFGRLVNLAWMLTAWSVSCVRPPNGLPDVVIVGTDPILSVLSASVWKRLRPRVKVAHWCFDLYPEAAIAEGLVKGRSPAARVARTLVRWAYRRCDLIADIGPCMRKRLDAYCANARRVTLTPWALSEPIRPEESDPVERQTLFGSASVGILYSGSFGLAHVCQSSLELARRLEGEGVRLAFSVRGNRAEALREDVARAGVNAVFVPFASEERLPRRLAAADIHLVSLRPEYTGAVVPSKFFGALAAGRPVLFEGSHTSAISQWTSTYDVGWTLTPDSVSAIAGKLIGFVQNPMALRALQERCHRVYHEQFSSKHVIDAWDSELRALIT